jgi:hypothetical protein
MYTILKYSRRYRICGGQIGTGTHFSPAACFRSLTTITRQLQAHTHSPTTNAIWSRLGTVTKN